MLSDRYAEELKQESAAIDSNDANQMAVLFEFSFSRPPSIRADGYNLFTTRFSNTYFGLRQCIEIDSIRYAIDSSTALSDEQKEWFIVALAGVLSRISTSTGHFAQPLLPKPNNERKIASQRKRSAWREWLQLIGNLAVWGTSSWRQGNKVFKMDASSLVRKLDGADHKPTVIYADPPYTKDQYSRYYHVYETLVKYDYPSAWGRGRYRDDRATSAYCLASQVDSAFDELISSCASLKTDLILSYPSSGLMKDSRKKIPALVKRYYKKAPHITEISHRHSTMGASKGVRISNVTEILYRACH